MALNNTCVVSPPGMPVKSRGFQRKVGLPEAVALSLISASLEGARKATGLERTILHATREGPPVYTRMGYRSVVKFPFYGPEEGNRA